MKDFDGDLWSESNSVELLGGKMVVMLESEGAEEKDTCWVVYLVATSAVI